MNTKNLLLGMAAAAAVAAAGCTNNLESGAGYPALEMGDRTLTFRLDAVMQNDTDVKPYFSFFDDVTLTLSYSGGEPALLTLAETGAPFRVTAFDYEESLEVEWEIRSADSPYEIRKKGTDETVCYMTRDRVVTFPFRLGAPSNAYEYRFVLVGESEE